MPLRFLLSLERESHIFLSLVGGSTACSVIRNAVKLYGDPASQIYLMMGSKQHVVALLHHLTVAIRGLGRVGASQDLGLLEDIKAKKWELIRLGDTPQHNALVERIMAWIDVSRENINQKT